MNIYYITTSLLGLIVSTLIFLKSFQKSKSAFPSLKYTQRFFFSSHTIYYIQMVIVTSMSTSVSERQPLSILLIGQIAFDWSMLFAIVLVKIIDKSWIILKDKKFMFTISFLSILIAYIDSLFVYNNGDLNPYWLLEYSYQMVLGLTLTILLLNLKKKMVEKRNKDKITYLLLGFILIYLISNTVFLLVPPEHYELYLEYLVIISIPINLVGLFLVFLSIQDRRRTKNKNYKINGKKGVADNFFRILLFIS